MIVIIPFSLSSFLPPFSSLPPLSLSSLLPPPFPFTYPSCEQQAGKCREFGGIVYHEGDDRAIAVAEEDESHLVQARAEVVAVLPELLQLLCSNMYT